MDSGEEVLSSKISRQILTRVEVRVHTADIIPRSATRRRKTACEIAAEEVQPWLSREFNECMHSYIHPTPAEYLQYVHTFFVLFQITLTLNIKS